MENTYIHCNGCGKRGYHTKRDAKRARSRTRGTIEGHLSIYRCVACPELWHVGHLPTQVLDGRMARGDLGTSAMRRKP